MKERYKEIVKKSGIIEKMKEIRERIWKEETMYVVMGNVSCDQDSFIGAHILAAIENKLPIVNLRKEIFICKKDLVFVAEIMGLSIEEIVFMQKEEKGWMLCKGDQKREVKDIRIHATLVDHNLPEKSLIIYPFFTVDRIIDHHPILEVNAEVHGHVQGMKIELEAGSCCSLVYREIKNRYKKEIEKNPSKYLFLVLLTIPIQTDTKCLTKRTHAVDIEGVEELLEMAGISAEESKKMFSLMKKKKKCENEIPTSLILQMDYKGFEYPPEYGKKTFGISSVKYAFDEWLERDKEDNFLAEVESFAKRKEHEFLLINSKTKGIREFFLYGSPGPNFAESILQENGKCNSREYRHGSRVITFYRTDVSLSRKLIAPKIYEYLKNTKTQ